MSPLLFVVIILTFIVVISVINERKIHLQQDIAVLLFSFLLCLAFLIIAKGFHIVNFENVVTKLSTFNFENYLMDGVLCLMIFAGSSKINIKKFRQNFKTITYLSLISTAISSVLFGLLFYAVAHMFGLEIDIWVAIMLGCIVSPTDPIAATGILNKLGISKNVLSVIESESLFNDGTGVALFIFVRSIVTNSGESNFFLIMFKEIFGALLVGTVISLLLFQFIKRTNKPTMQVIISLLSVSSIYVICEHFGFSGVIGSVVCGMLFAYMMNKIERQREVYDSAHVYENFWETVDSILNSMLFVMIGISVISISPDKNLIVLLLIGVFALILSRFVGVLSSAIVSRGKNVPGNYSVTEFSLLLTWTALKGGLSLALALGTKEFLSQDVYSIVLTTTYCIIMFSVLVQGLSIKPVYKYIEKQRIKRLGDKK